MSGVLVLNESSARSIQKDNAKIVDEVLRDIKESIDACNAKIEQLNAEAEKLENDAKTLNKKIPRYKQDGSIYYEEVPDWEKRTIAAAKAKELRNAIGELNNAINELESAGRNLKSLLSQTNMQLDILIEKLQSTDTKYAKAIDEITNEILRYIKTMDDIYNSFDDVSLTITSNVPGMSEIANLILNIGKGKVAYNPNGNVTDMSRSFLVPFYINIEGRDADAYNVIIDQFDVETNRRYAKNEKGTYCNVFVMDVTAAMNVPIPRVINGYETRANHIYEYLLAGNDGWREISASEAQARANAGYPTVSAWHSGSNASGHVQVIRPSADGSTDVIITAQAGVDNYNYGPISKGFGTEKLKTTKFFTHD